MKTKEKGGINRPQNRAKDTHFVTQYKTVFQSFKERPKTMLEVSIETGILRANICRYIRTMRKSEQMQVIRKGFFPITKHIAGFITTDKNLFQKPKVQQLKLF